MYLLLFDVAMRLGSSSRAPCIVADARIASNSLIRRRAVIHLSRWLVGRFELWPLEYRYREKLRRVLDFISRAEYFTGVMLSVIRRFFSAASRLNSGEFMRSVLKSIHG